MRDAIILSAVSTVATASVVSALALIWLCVQAHKITHSLVASSDHVREVVDIMQCTVLDALAGVQEEVLNARAATDRAMEKLDIATELGYQNAEAASRIEVSNAEVASNLADSVARADAAPIDSGYGAAADAASRSPQANNPKE